MRYLLLLFIALPLCAEELRFTVDLEDGQRLTGVIPASLEVKTRFGKITLKTANIHRIETKKDHTEIHFANGDKLHGTLLEDLLFTAEIGSAWDLLETPFQQLSRRHGESLATPWSEAVNGLRSRLRLVESPKNDESGELVFEMELQNTTATNLTVEIPEFHPRVVSPKEMPTHARAWITCSGEQLLLQARERRLEEFEQVQTVYLKPQGSLVFRIVVPVEIRIKQAEQNRGGMRQLKKIAEQQRLKKEGKRIPVERHVEPVGTDTLDTLGGDFRGYFRIKMQGGERWHGTLLTPLLKTNWFEHQRNR